MEYCYLKFDTNTNTEKSYEKIAFRAIKNSAIKILTTILPISSSDYDDEIYRVKKWLVEFEKNTEHPNREIGIGQNNNIITISPWDGRYAYWADVNLKLKDFKRQFNAIDINGQEFERLWNSFKKNSNK